MTLKILVADDSPTIQRIIKASFAEEDVVVISAVDGTQALKILEKEDVHIILADIHMPEPGGYELCTVIKTDTRFKDIPVILLARKEEEIDRNRIKSVGARAYLIKPIEPLELLALVKQLCYQKTSPESGGDSDILEELLTSDGSERDQTETLPEPGKEDRLPRPSAGSPDNLASDTSRPGSHEELSKLLGQYMLQRLENILRETLDKTIPVKKLEAFTRDIVIGLAEKMIREEIDKIKKGDLTA